MKRHSFMDTSLNMTPRLFIFVISAAGTFATLLGFAASLHRRKLHNLSRTARGLIVLTVLAISIATAIVWLHDEQNRERTTDSMSRAPAQQKERQEVRIATSVVTGEKTTPHRQSIERPQTERAVAHRDAITVDEAAKNFPDATLAAEDALNMLRSPTYRVQGRLRGSQSEPDPTLAGMITTAFTLDIKCFDSHGVVQRSFTITSRGGGFTSDSSALQARERLHDSLGEHLKREQQ